MIEVQFPSFNAINKEYSSDIFLRVYTSAFTSGLVATLKPTNFTVFLAICSFMDSKGECFPSQRQIAERCGLSKTTINRAINDLLAFEIEGKKIVERRFVGKNGNSVYSVLPIGQIAIFDQEVEAIPAAAAPEPVKPESAAAMKPKDVLTYYSEVYRDVYGVNPAIRWAVDTSLVKKKWIGQYSDDQIRRMIEISIKEYDGRWKNSKFPRPTIAAIVSWIGESALAVALDVEKEQAQITELVGNEDEAEAAAAARMAAIFGGGQS